MNNQEILEQLKKVGGNAVRIPSNVSFKLYGDTLEIALKSICVTKNMQDNYSAVEGWACCIKACIENVKEVLVKWEKPSEKEEQWKKKRMEKNEVDAEESHYNRFLYRMLKFKENYSWVKIDKSNIGELVAFKSLHKNLVMNFPKSFSSSSAAGLEHIVERKFIEFLSEKYNTRNIINHQLPVGLFDKEVKKINTVTPRGGSQIDLWRMDEEKKDFFVYELKIAGNSLVGIISELMFYVNVMNDLKNGTIKYPETLNKQIIANNEIEVLRDIDKIQNKIGNKDFGNYKIKGVFLTEDLHVLIEKRKANILSILNQNASGLEFGFVNYKFVENKIEILP